jgi:hypothetical protein
MAGNEQLIQPRPAERARGHLRHRHLDDGVQGPVGPVAVHRATAHESHPDASLGIDRQTVGLDLVKQR